MSSPPLIRDQAQADDDHEQGLAGPSIGDWYGPKEHHSAHGDKGQADHDGRPLEPLVETPATLPRKQIPYGPRRQQHQDYVSHITNPR